MTATSACQGHTPKGVVTKLGTRILVVAIAFATASACTPPTDGPTSPSSSSSGGTPSAQSSVTVITTSGTRHVWTLDSFTYTCTGNSLLGGPPPSCGGELTIRRTDCTSINVSKGVQQVVRLTGRSANTCSTGSSTWWVVDVSYSGGRASGWVSTTMVGVRGRGVSDNQQVDVSFTNLDRIEFAR